MVKDCIVLSSTAMLTVKKRPLRAVGLLILFSAFVMEFFQQRDPLITDVGIVDGRGDNVSVFIRGGSGGEGFAAEMVPGAALAESGDDADYQELSDEQRSGVLAAGVVVTRIDVDEQSKGDAFPHSTNNDEEGKTAEQNELASSIVIPPLSENSTIDDVAVQKAEPSEQSVPISTGVVQPSKSTNPVEQIILLGERHSGADLVADHLAECFDIKVNGFPHLGILSSPCVSRSD